MGSILGDVTKTLGAIVSAEQGDLRDLSNVLQGKPTVAEQQQNLWDQLTKAATTTPQGPGQLTSEMQIARAQNDLPGFIKASGKERSRSALLDTVIASNLSQPEQETFKRRIMAGDDPTKIWDDYNQAQNRLAMQSQKQEAAVQSEQRQTRMMQKQQEMKKQSKEESSITNRAKQYNQENPNATADQWASWLRLQGVKPDNVEQTLKDLESQQIKMADPTLWDKVKNAFSNLISPPKPAVAAKPKITITRLPNQ